MPISESEQGKVLLLLGHFLPTPLWRYGLRSPCFWWRFIHRRWWIIRRKISYGFILRMIMIHDAYLLQIWTGPFVPFLVFATGFGLSFMLALLFFWFWCEVELELYDFNIESEAYAVPDEDLVAWEELVTFLDAVIYFSVVLSQSCWFVCSVKPWHVCLGFHRGEEKLWSRLCMAFEQSNYSP